MVWKSLDGHCWNYNFCNSYEHLEQWFSAVEDFDRVVEFFQKIKKSAY